MFVPCRSLNCISTTDAISRFLEYFYVPFSLCLFNLLLGSRCAHLASVSLGRSPRRLSVSHEMVLGRVVIAMRSTHLPCDQDNFYGLSSWVCFL